MLRSVISCGRLPCHVTRSLRLLPASAACLPCRRHSQALDATCVRLACLHPLAAQSGKATISLHMQPPPLPPLPHSPYVASSTELIPCRNAHDWAARHQAWRSTVPTFRWQGNIPLLRMTPLPGMCWSSTMMSGTRQRTLAGRSSSPSSSLPSSSSSPGLCSLRGCLFFQPSGCLGI